MGAPGAEKGVWELPRAFTGPCQFPGHRHFLQEFIWPDLSEEALDEKVNWQLRESYGHFSLISGSVALKRVIGGTAVTMRGVYASKTFRIL